MSKKYAECSGFKIDEHLFAEIKINGCSYFKIAEKSLCEQDTDYIHLLSQFKDGDGIMVYQHGAILIEIIDNISEEEYLKIIRNLPIEQQERIVDIYLSAGLDYTVNAKYQNKDIENAFPLLYSAINNKY